MYISARCRSCLFFIDERQTSFIADYPAHCTKGRLEYPDGEKCPDWRSWAEHYREVLDADNIPEHRQ